MVPITIPIIAGESALQRPFSNKAATRGSSGVLRPGEGTRVSPPWPITQTCGTRNATALAKSSSAGDNCRGASDEGETLSSIRTRSNQRCAAATAASHCDINSSRLLRFTIIACRRPYNKVVTCETVECSRVGGSASNSATAWAVNDLMPSSSWSSLPPARKSNGFARGSFDSACKSMVARCASCTTLANALEDALAPTAPTRGRRRSLDGNMVLPSEKQYRHRAECVHRARMRRYAIKPM